jgi:hypothetical protein
LFSLSSFSFLLSLNNYFTSCSSCPLNSGRKSGKGFYNYGGNSKSSKQFNENALAIIAKYRKSSTAPNYSVKDIQMRMVGRFINEAVFCLGECRCLFDV